MFNIPNTLTLLRMLTAPLIIVLFYYEGKITCLLATFFFLLACFTDFLDGYIARRSNIVTSVGKFLDPLADKVLISSVLIILVHLHWIEAWIAIVIICRDLIVTGLRAIAADEGIVMAADTFGKIKTVLQMIALVPLMIHYAWFGLSPQPVGQFLLYIALVLTVLSGINYLMKFYRIWAEKPKKS